MDELLPIFGRYKVVIFYPRLTEQSVSAPDYAEIERTASWTGRTVASMQVWDILRAVQWIVAEEKTLSPSIAVYGKEGMGILGLYAALFDEHVKQVILDNPPASHWQGPALLNILRVSDIPEVAGAFAPRRLVFITEAPKPFDYTRRVYKLLGKKDLGTTTFPPRDTTLISGDIGFRQHSGGHTPGPNWPVFLEFAAKYFDGSNTQTMAQKK